MSVPTKSLLGAACWYRIIPQPASGSCRSVRLHFGR